MPQKSLFKLDNMYLVALFNTAHLKDDFADFDNVLNVIVKDIRLLETKGIDINGKNIKESLALFSFDNLGGNDLYGFVKSFNTDYFCRHCTCKKVELRQMTREDPNLLRTKDQYQQCIDQIEENESEDLVASKGIKKYCVLNNLKHFHITTNKTVDLMHDCNEGAIIFALHNIFSYCISNKLLKKIKSKLKCVITTMASYISETSHLNLMLIDTISVKTLLNCIAYLYIFHSFYPTSVKN